MSRPASMSGKGISKSTWERAEKARGRIRSYLYADIERLFDWPFGSIVRYLDEQGTEPRQQTDMPDEGPVLPRLVQPLQVFSVKYRVLLTEEDQRIVENLVHRLAR